MEGLECDEWTGGLAAPAPGRDRAEADLLQLVRVEEDLLVPGLFVADELWAGLPRPLAESLGRCVELLQTCRAHEASAGPTAELFEIVSHCAPDLQSALSHVVQACHEDDTPTYRRLAEVASFVSGSVDAIAWSGDARAGAATAPGTATRPLADRTWPEIPDELRVDYATELPVIELADGVDVPPQVCDDLSRYNELAHAFGDAAEASHSGDPHAAERLLAGCAPGAVRLLESMAGHCHAYVGGRAVLPRHAGHAPDDFDERLFGVARLGAAAGYIARRLTQNMSAGEHPASGAWAAREPSVPVLGSSEPPSGSGLPPSGSSGSAPGAVTADQACADAELHRVGELLTEKRHDYGGRWSARELMVKPLPRPRAARLDLGRRLGLAVRDRTVHELQAFDYVHNLTEDARIRLSVGWETSRTYGLGLPIVSAVRLVLAPKEVTWLYAPANGGAYFAANLSAQVTPRYDPRGSIDLEIHVTLTWESATPRTNTDRSGSLVLRGSGGYDATGWLSGTVRQVA